MKSLTTGTRLIVMALLPGSVAGQSLDRPSASHRVEMRAKMVVNLEGAPVESCEVIQTKNAGPGLSFTSWSTLAESVPADTERSQTADPSRPPHAISHCGPGALPSPVQTSARPAPAPVIVNQVTADVGWASGTMDPGAVGALLVSLTITSRDLTGLSPEGRPVYTVPSTERRSTRLEPGEEYFAPVRVDTRRREALGIHEVLLRIRAEWAGRDGATEYGALEIVGVAPGSDIFLDGRVIGRAGADGGLQLAHVPVGWHDVRLRGTSRSVVSRSVSVVKGRTVAVAPLTAGTPSRAWLTPLGKNSSGFQEYRRERDGAVMIQVPEGEFLMGNLATEGSPLPHTVDVSSFLMDKLPLTVGRFKQFAAATGRPLPPEPYWGVHDNFPVAFVRWDEAKAYCEWAGGRLPTEAEREKATRGTDGRLWPWGSDSPGPERGVFRGNWGLDGPDTVGIRPAGASPYGLLDTGGNMWEFTEDWWDANYFKVSPPRNPRGPVTGVARVVKGGSWDSRPTVLSASSRNFAYTGYREGDFGFRCAADNGR